MTDENQAASQEPAATDLDSIIDGALKDYGSDAPAPEAAADTGADEKPEQVEIKADHPTDPTRYADGTFKPQKEDSAAPAASQEPTAEAAKPAAIKATEPALQPLEAPARWTAEKKAQFAAWPRDVQEAVLARNGEIEADYTRKTQEAAELRRSAEPILNAIKPWEGYLNQIAPRIGQTPDKMIASLVGVEYNLRTGEPHEKVQALYNIAASYGIDLAAISRGELPAAPDPAYTQLRQSFGTLEQQVAQLRADREAEQQRQTASEIEMFQNAKDTSGRPLHPHFERVRGVMGQLIGADSSLSLKAAYEKAIEPINAAVAEELRQRTETAERERLASVEKARKAAPVKTAGSAPNGSAKAKDLDALLWDNINAKIA